MYSKLGSYLQKPFNEDGDIWQWAFFIVLVTTISFFWTRVIKSIVESVE